MVEVALERFVLGSHCGFTSANQCGSMITISALPRDLHGSFGRCRLCLPTGDVMADFYSTKRTSSWDATFAGEKGDECPSIASNQMVRSIKSSLDFLRNPPPILVPSIRTVYNIGNKILLSKVLVLLSFLARALRRISKMLISHFRFPLLLILICIWKPAMAQTRVIQQQPAIQMKRVDPYPPSNAKKPLGVTWMRSVVRLLFVK